MKLTKDNMFLCEGEQPGQCNLKSLFPWRLDVYNHRLQSVEAIFDPLEIAYFATALASTRAKIMYLNVDVIVSFDLDNPMAPRMKLFMGSQAGQQRTFGNKDEQVEELWLKSKVKVQAHIDKDGLKRWWSYVYNVPDIGITNFPTYFKSRINWITEQVVELLVNQGISYGEG